MASSASRPRRSRRRKLCVGCSLRPVRRRWTYCTVCAARLARGEQVGDRDDVADTEFMRALRGPVAPSPPTRLGPRRRRGHLEPGDLVRCDFHACTLAVKVCLQRQDARWPGRGWRAAIYERCGSGRCKQGAEYRRRTVYVPSLDWASRSKSHSPRYQAFRKDAGLQRQKRRLQMLSRPEGDAPTIDSPLGARLQTQFLPEINEVVRMVGR